MDLQTNSGLEEYDSELSAPEIDSFKLVSFVIHWKIYKLKTNIASDW